MRVLFAIGLVATLTISAIAQDCYTDASGRQVCPLRKAVRSVAAAPVRLLAVEQPVAVIASNGCSGAAAATAICGGSLRTVYRRAPLRTLRERLGARRTAFAGCGGN